MQGPQEKNAEETHQGQRNKGVQRHGAGRFQKEEHQVLRLKQGMARIRKKRRAAKLPVVPQRKFPPGKTAKSVMNRRVNLLKQPAVFRQVKRLFIAGSLHTNPEYRSA
ncbi:MAG: hypothetical protein BWX80_01599 [Candidatus Hydrogenedentes bacterium ADurb.Bin101]|nr:MAG: hypothetical protein BWX80_01599 [Candidatus Hydrogenedentes bacterium ADurb.Bin101]